MIGQSEARQLANNATPEQIKEMLITARSQIKNWTKAGSNNAIDLGATFNIFWPESGDFEGMYRNVICRINAIRNFGEYFPGRAKPTLKPKQKPTFSQEPRITPSEEWPF